MLILMYEICLPGDKHLVDVWVDKEEDATKIAEALGGVAYYELSGYVNPDPIAGVPMWTRSFEGNADHPPMAWGVSKEESGWEVLESTSNWNEYTVNTRVESCAAGIAFVNAWFAQWDE